MSKNLLSMYSRLGFLKLANDIAEAAENMGSQDNASYSSTPYSLNPTLSNFDQRLIDVASWDKGSKEAKATLSKLYKLKPELKKAVKQRQSFLKENNKYLVGKYHTNKINQYNLEAERHALAVDLSFINAFIASLEAMPEDSIQKNRDAYDAWTSENYKITNRKSS